MGIGDMMARMDKYEEPNEDVYSRTLKNEDLYKDVYLNNTLIDLNKIINEEEDPVIEEHEEILELEEVYYEEKEYSLSKFLNKRRENLINDNLPRSLDESIKESDDEINKLILKLEQKEKENDLFVELLPDDDMETTILEGQGEKLDSYVSDEAINNFVMNKDLSETNSFMDLEETKVNLVPKTKNKLKLKTLPLVMFCSTLLLLIAFIIYLVITKVIVK